MGQEVSAPWCHCKAWNVHATWCLYGQWVEDQMCEARERSEAK